MPVSGGATLTASVPLATSLTPAPCVMAVSLDAACRQHVSCLSQGTQATITTSAIGTQCLPMFLSTSSQTGEEFPDLEMDSAQAGASEKSPTGQIEADITTEAHLPTFCQLLSGKTGSLIGGLHGRWKFCSCLFCQQWCNYPSTDGKVCASKVPYTCPVCKKVFREKRNLVGHVRVHTGERPYMCNICQKSFTHRASLSSHKNSHSAEKRYMCSFCQKSFMQRAHVVRHERLHSREKPYVCSICQKGFTQNDHLIRHKVVHSGERPFVCSICQKSFTQKTHLYLHEKLHSGQKPYACSICQKGFIKKHLLVAHEMSHSGKKPYTCSICQKGFTQKAYLVRHEKVHSGESL